MTGDVNRHFIPPVNLSFRFGFQCSSRELILHHVKYAIALVLLKSPRLHFNLPLVNQELVPRPDGFSSMYVDILTLFYFNSLPVILLINIKKVESCAIASKGNISIIYRK